MSAFVCNQRVCGRTIEVGARLDSGKRRGHRPVSWSQWHLSGAKGVEVAGYREFMR